jgi:hypothetical protein
MVKSFHRALTNFLELSVRFRGRQEVLRHVTTATETGLKFLQDKEDLAVVATLKASKTLPRGAATGFGATVSADVDGAAEEGTPFILAHGMRRTTFTPNPAGFRFYHTHNHAGANLAAGQYSGEVGPAYIEAAQEPVSSSGRSATQVRNERRFEMFLPHHDGSAARFATPVIADSSALVFARD